MKNLFGILCIFALVAVTLGASATPDIVETPIVCVDDYSPDIADLSPTVVVVKPDLPAFETVYVFDCSPTFTASPFSRLNCPIESPDIGCSTNFTNDVNNSDLSDSYSPEPSDSYSPEPTDSGSPDLTIGESAECNVANGANDVSNYLPDCTTNTATKHVATCPYGSC